MSMASQQFRCLTQASILAQMRSHAAFSSLAPKSARSFNFISRARTPRLSRRGICFTPTRFASAVIDPAAEFSPPQRSLLRRFLSVFAIGIISSTAGFAMATVPAVSAANDLISPPTNAETLSMYTPPDEESAEINAALTSHPVALALRADPNFVESRPYFKIPDSARQHTLTGGILCGPGRIWVPPLTFAEKDGKSMTILYYLGNDVSGYPGIVHGGLLATLLDEALARCSFGALPNKVSMTANLNIDYRKPMPTNRFIVARAELERVEGRKAWVRGWLESAEAEDGMEPTKYVEAKGLFVEPRQAATMNRLYPAATSST